MGRAQEQATQIGVLGLLPLAVAALGLWLSPWLLPKGYALDLHQMALAYAGVIAAWLAGAGGSLAAPGFAAPRLVGGAVAVLIVWIAIWPGGLFHLSIGAVWRYLLVISVLFYLWARDRRAVEAGLLPVWYGALRTRLTFWATACLMLIVCRLLLWGYY